MSSATISVRVTTITPSVTRSISSVVPFTRVSQSRKCRLITTALKETPHTATKLIAAFTAAQLLMLPMSSPAIAVPPQPAGYPASEMVMELAEDGVDVVDKIEDEVVPAIEETIGNLVSEGTLDKAEASALEKELETVESEISNADEAAESGGGSVVEGVANGIQDQIEALKSILPKF